MEGSKLSEQVDRLIEATNRLGTVNNTSGIHIHGSGLVAVIAGACGFLATVVAISAVIVVSDRAEQRDRANAEIRETDMKALEGMRNDMNIMQAYVTRHGERISKLEAPK